LFHLDNKYTGVQNNLAKGQIATPRGGEWTRQLRALDESEQCVVPAAYECKDSSIGT